MKSNTEWLGEGKFESRGTRTSEPLLMEGPESIGGTGQGHSPMELLLHGVAGCMAIDIKHILRHKFDAVTSLKLAVEGERREDYPQKYENITISVYMEGDVLAKDLVRATTLSKDKYCSAVNSLSATITLVNYLNGEAVQ